MRKPRTTKVKNAEELAAEDAMLGRTKEFGDTVRRMLNRAFTRGRYGPASREAMKALYQMASESLSTEEVIDIAYILTRYGTGDDDSFVTEHMGEFGKRGAEKWRQKFAKENPRVMTNAERDQATSAN